MTTRSTIHRVDGDDGPPISVTHRGVDVAGWTITARFKKPDGTLYTSDGIIDVGGDPGTDVPAEYHFPFAAGNLTEGEHKWDIHYSDASIDDYSIPSREKFAMLVRA